MGLINDWKEAFKERKTIFGKTSDLNLAWEDAKTGAKESGTRLRDVPKQAANAFGESLLVQSVKRALGK